MAQVLRYGSARLFASVANSPGVLRSLNLVNNISFGFNINRQRVKSMGYSKVLSKAISPASPSVTFSYFLSDLDNERLFGLPVTSHEVIDLKNPVFKEAIPFDLAFALEENNKDFKRLSTPDHQDVSICLITNAYITSYSFEVNEKGIINANVSFTGDDILFKIFKNLSGYSVLEEDSEDNLMTSQNEFVINDGTEELTSNIGGGNLISKVKDFSFSANIPHKELIDFGQYFNKKKIDHPFETSISVSAYVDSFFEGKLSNVFCGDKTNDFILSNKRVECDGKINEKSGMLFKGAQLLSQSYTIGTSGYLLANLDFSLTTNRSCGIYFTQHVQTGEVLVGENTSAIDHILLEDSSTGAAKIIIETIKDMVDSIKEFRLKGACSVIT